MFKIGDAVFFENMDTEDGELDILSGKIVETNLDRVRGGVNSYFKTDADHYWRSEYEIFNSKTDLADYLTGQIKEDRKHILDDINAIEEEVEEMKSHFRAMDRKLKTLNNIRD